MCKQFTATATGSSAKLTAAVSCACCQHRCLRTGYIQQQGKYGALQLLNASTIGGALKDALLWCCCRYNITRKHMEQLVESIQSLGYQFILIDCPAGIDVGFINAISPAKEALIVTTPEITSIRDADRVAGLLEANNIYNTKLLVNRVRPDMIQKNDMMSVRDVQVGTAAGSDTIPSTVSQQLQTRHAAAFTCRCSDREAVLP
jgi:MinD superfamily P-loop ATPase